MAFFSHRSGGFDVHDEIKELRRQIAALGRSASRRGASAYREARQEADGLYDEIGERVAGAMPVMRRKARALEDTIREHPAQAVAVVGLAMFLVAAICMLGSERR